MTTLAISLHANTDLDDLVADHPGLDRVSSALRDMIAAGDFGCHEVELGDDVLRDADTELQVTGTGIDVLYLPAVARAAICDGGGTHWTDAASVEDAIRRYREDDLAQ